MHFSNYVSFCYDGSPGCLVWLVCTCRASSARLTVSHAGPTLTFLLCTPPTPPAKPASEYVSLSA